MSWAKTPYILLIWPKGERIALRSLDLKMLQRHARSLGATLGLVSRDPRVRREAAALKLPVFDSPRAAQSDLWIIPVRPKFSSSRKTQDLRALRDIAYSGQDRGQVNPIIRIGSFALGVLAVLTLSLLFLPHAVITLSLESKIQSLTIPVTADPALNSIIITGGVPARTGTYEVAGTQQITSTGEMTIAESEAKGVARFRNFSSSTIQIPMGTIVHTLGASPIRFMTTQLAEIAAGTGKIVDVPIEALGMGASGNLGVDLIQVIEGPLGVSLSVTNPAPTSGGTDRVVAAPNAEDREHLRELVMENLRAQVQLAMLTDLPFGSVILPDTVRDVVVVEELVDPAAGKTGGILTMTMRVKFTAQYASGNDLSELASLALSASLEDGFSPTPELPTFHTIGVPVTDETGRTGFQLRLERPIRRTVDVNRVLLLVQSQPMESAMTRLNDSFNLTSQPIIKMTPRWWPWLPLLPFRMSVVIQ